MKIFLGGRQTGKTTFLLRWLAATPQGVLVCHSNSEAARLHKTHPDLADRIVSVSAVQDGRLRGRQNVVIAVDNLDLTLPYLIGGTVGPVTATDDTDPYWFD